MEEKDLKQIKELFEQGFQEGFAQIWEGNLEPAFDALNDRLDIVQTKLDKALFREFQRIDMLEQDMKIVKEKLGISQ